MMAHVRPGKTAKRNRQLGALERLQEQLDRHERRQLRDRSYRLLTDGTYGENVSVRIKAEIAALESRI